MELPNIIRLDHFYNQHRYASESGISLNTTRNRIKSQLIAAIIIDGCILVDVSQSPPTARYKPNVYHPKLNVVLPNGMDKEQLVNVTSYANRKQAGPAPFFRAILNGKIFGLVAGEEVFALKKELDAL